MTTFRYGSDGADLIVGDSLPDINDYISGGTQSNPGNDIGDDTLYGQSGNDTLLGWSGNDRLNGGIGNDSIDGGDGNDQLLTDDSGSDTLLGGNGNDSLSFFRRTSVSNVFVDGGSDNDTIEGYSYFDTQVIDLQGGPGDDVFKLYNNLAGSKIDGGDGLDILHLMPTYIGLTSTTQLISVEQIDMAEGYQIIGTISNNFFDFTGFSITNIGSNYLFVDAAEGDDTIIGGSEQDFFSTMLGNGRTGNDSVDGGAGDDTLYGSGNDTLLGGDGRDLLNFLNNSAGNVYVDGGAGDDTLRGDGYLATAPTILGGEGDDVFQLGSFRSIAILDGGGGIDTLEPNGMFFISNTGQLAGIERIDLYRGAQFLGGPSAVFFDFSQFVLVNLGAGYLSATGAGLNDTLIGGAEKDLLSGAGGDDSLVGNAGEDKLYGTPGNDTLDGGADADILDGGSGDDVYIADNQADQIVERPGWGTDTVIATVSFTLYAGVEHLILDPGAPVATIGAGNELANRITGNDFGNSLFGQAGADTLLGGAATDFLYGGDDGDSMSGAGGVDQVVGEAGNDTLDGGTGDDVLLGGPGDDTYLVDSGLDLVDEGNLPIYASFGFGGTDTIISTANFFWDVYSVGEVLRIDPTASDPGGVGTTAVGGVFDNTLIGNAGTNILFGRGGSDIYRPGDGIDYVSFSTLGVVDVPGYTARGVNTLIVDPRATGPLSYDIVFEFISGRDKIDVSGYHYASEAEVLARGQNDGLGNCFFALGDGLDFVYVVGLTTAQIGAGDFIV